MACFSAPVLHDVIDPTVANFAAARNEGPAKVFFIREASKMCACRRILAIRLAAAMAVEAPRFAPGLATLARTRELIARKYSTIAWLEKVS